MSQRSSPHVIEPLSSLQARLSRSLLVVSHRLILPCLVVRRCTFREMGPGPGHMSRVPKLLPPIVVSALDGYGHSCCHPITKLIKTLIDKIVELRSLLSVASFSLNLPSCKFSTYPLPSLSFSTLSTLQLAAIKVEVVDCSSTAVAIAWCAVVNCLEV